MRRTLVGAAAMLLSAVLPLRSSSAEEPGCHRQEGEEREDAREEKIVSGATGVVRKAPKRWGTFLGAEEGPAIRLHLDGDPEPTTWPLLADAEVKVVGFWGRPSMIPAGDRVWVWFRIDREKRPVSVFFLADEVSQQDLNNLPHTLKAIDTAAGTVTFEDAAGATRALRLAEGLSVSAEAGAKVFVQSAGEAARLLLDAEGLEAARAAQRERLRALWESEGLPGTVTFLHAVSGEMEAVLDHEAMRWTRALRTGDEVEIAIADPIVATVKLVEPWRERTRLRLVADGFRQGELSIGRRIGVRVRRPPAEVLDSRLPPDAGRERSGAERIEWVLASTYCTCSIGGDGCTGMVYTLASCDRNRCGMPNRIRGLAGKLIDDGLGDGELIEALERERGPLLLKQHLLR